MQRLINAAGLFLISVITGGLYAVVIGLFYSPFRAPVIAWPILTTLFWFVFWKFKVLRFVGFMFVVQAKDFSQSDQERVNATYLRRFP